MNKFRAFAATFGEFVAYERDRGGRDIGIHLTHRSGSKKERLSSALCWFQMKGIQKTTLSSEKFDSLSEIKIRLSAEHLKYWWLQPVPTYLVLYIESKDQFLVLNISKYVDEKLGRKILSIKQKTLDVLIPKHSVLDPQAFRLILAETDTKEWLKAINTDEASAKLCLRDHQLIWEIGSNLRNRKLSYRVVFWEWQSKTRGQLRIQKRAGKGDWEDIREHWQYRMHVEDLESAYPYLDFFSLEDTDDSDWSWSDGDEDSEVPPVKLRNGQLVNGANAAWEYFEYEFGIKLNSLGKKLYELVKIAKDAGLVEISEGSEWVSFAPWHHRAV